MRRLILLRPEPGLSASAERARAMGVEVVAHPLFNVECVDAEIPDGPFDALVVTSANAVRCGADLLDRYRELPAYAVGEATARSMREAGIEPTFVGSGGVDGLDLPRGRWIHPCGEVHRPLPGDAVSVAVYRTAPAGDDLPEIADTVVAVHSPAIGARLDRLARAFRARTMIAAISPAAAAACGDGWEAVHASPSPDDAALLALAAALCQSARP